MYLKTYTAIVSILLIFSNNIQTASSNQNHTNSMDGWLMQGTFTPINEGTINKIKDLARSTAHSHKITNNLPPIELLEMNILYNCTELNSFLNHHNAKLSKNFLNGLYTYCLHEYHNCTIQPITKEEFRRGIYEYHKTKIPAVLESLLTTTENKTIPAPPIINGH